MEVVFHYRHRAKLKDRPDDYQNTCLAVAWDGQDILMSVFEGVITTLQALSAAFASADQWEPYFPGRITKQWVCILKAWVPLNVLV